MSGNARETRLSAAFVRMADTPVDDFDVIDLLQSLVGDCVDLVDVQAAGVLLANGHGRLELAASTSKQADVVEVLQLKADTGPGVQCFHTGQPVCLPDMNATGPVWDDFRVAALMQGFQSVLAMPLRVRGEVIGAMSLFRTATGPLSPGDTAIAQALAHVATVCILQHRAVRETSIVNEQLARALDSRIVIEQAKGILAESGDLSLDEALTLLRAHARDNNLPLRTVAEQIAARAVNIATRAPNIPQPNPEHTPAERRTAAGGIPVADGLP